ncbi:MAG: ATP-binding cassette domain-containing protein [Polyangiaceae bacterium]
MIRLTNAISRVAPQQVGPVSLFLGPGAYAFVGRTTDGVSLLLETIAGRTRPTSGKVETLNVAPTSAKARQAIGYVALDAPLPEVLSVAATLALASKLRGEPVLDPSERLAKVGIEPLVHRRISSLTLAERRAVAFAEVVTSTKTQLLLVDEPLIHMDARAAAGVAHLLRQRASQGACVVIATASTQDALLLASEAIAFDRSKLIWRGKPADRVALARGQAVRVTVTASDVRGLGAALARDARAVRVTVEDALVVAEGTTLVDVCAAIATAARHAHVEVTSIVPDAAPLDDLFAAIREESRNASAHSAAQHRPPPPISSPVLGPTRAP